MNDFASLARLAKETVQGIEVSFGLLVLLGMIGSVWNIVEAIRSSRAWTFKLKRYSLTADTRKQLSRYRISTRVLGVSEGFRFIQYLLFTMAVIAALSIPEAPPAPSTRAVSHLLQTIFLLYVIFLDCNTWLTFFFRRWIRGLE